MRNRSIGSILAVVAVLAVPVVICAQTAPQPGAAEATPDLSGIWSRPGFFPTFMEGEPPMQPWVKEIYDGIQNARNAVSRESVDNLDEDEEWLKIARWREPGDSCVPRGVPRAYLQRRPFEIYQLPGRVIIIYEADWRPRLIYTDGRGHPEGAPSAFMGHSIGKWDGDTFVVETIGLMGGDATWLDSQAHPHSDALRVVERLRRVNHDTLEIDVLIDDPKMYTKPWGGKMVFQLKPDWELIEGISCEEHFREDHLPEIRRLNHGGWEILDDK